jgi:O-antigen/teichoic acid export membrane protein
MGMLRNSVYVYSAFIYLNLLVYVFHSILGKSLGKEGYGEFSVVYSLIFSIGYLASILSTLSVKTIIENFDRRFELLQSMRFFGLIFGLGFGALAVIFSDYLKDFLNVTEGYYFYFVGVSWFVLFPLVVEKSFLQASGRFGLFAFSNGFEMTVRVIVAYTSLHIGLKVEAGIIAYLSGIIVVESVLLLNNRGWRFRKAKLDIKRLFKIALYAFPVGFFIYADDIFIRRIFSPETAGIYASVSAFGKFLLWSVVALMDVYFPKFVESKMDRSLRKYLFQIFAVAFFLEILFQTLVAITGKSLFNLVFGSAFISAYEYVPKYLISILSLIFVLIFVSLATSLERGIIIVYLNLICFYGGFFIIDFSSIEDYLFYLFAVNFIFVLFYLYSFRQLIFKS